MENNRRLYVLIDKSLSPVYGCVQGGHVVAQWLYEHPDNEWKNAYLIYLYADVKRYKKKLIRNKVDFSQFREPDLDGKITAIACLDSGKLFKNLHTVKV